MAKTYKVNMITVDGRTVPVAHRVFESYNNAKAYAQQLIESSGYRSSEIVENQENLKAAVEFQFPDGDDVTATRVVRVIEIPKSGAANVYPEYIGTEINKSAEAKKLRAQGARLKRTLVTWRGNLEDAIAQVEQRANSDLLPNIKQDAQARLRRLKDAHSKISQNSMNENITAVSLATAERKIRDGEWEAMQDLNPGRHVEIRVTKNNKRKTYYIKEDIATDAISMEHDHEVQMARGQLYHAARDAMRLHKILKGISEDQGLEGWVAAKITKASDYLNSVADYMEYEHVTNTGTDLRGIDDVTEAAGHQVWPGQKKRKFYAAPQDKDGKTDIQKWAEKRREERKARKEQEAAKTNETTAGSVASVVMPMGQPIKRKPARKH